MKHLLCVFVVTALFSPALNNAFAGRYYDARIARFTTPDPLLNKNPKELLESGQTVAQGTSPYNYGLNNPVALVDPDGNFPFFFVAVAAAYLLTQYSGDHLGGSPSLTTDAVVFGTAGAPYAGMALFQTALANPAATVTVITGLGEALAPPGGSLLPAGTVAKAINAEGKSAFQIAKEGGAHAGYLNNMIGKEVKSIESAVASYGKNVAEHIDKISNPSKYIKDWIKLSRKEQQFLFQKWQGDLKRNQQLQDVMKGLLDEIEGQ